MAEPRTYDTAEEVLDRTRVLFAQADLYARWALEDLRTEADDPRLVRAAQLAQVATAGARLAAALLFQAADEATDRREQAFLAALGDNNQAGELFKDDDPVRATIPTQLGQPLITDPQTIKSGQWADPPEPGDGR